MAGQTPTIDFADMGAEAATEAVTRDDLHIVIVSNGESDDEEPLVVFKAEEEIAEDWRLLACGRAGESCYLQDEPSFVQEDNEKEAQQPCTSPSVVTGGDPCVRFEVEASVGKVGQASAQRGEEVALGCNGEVAEALHRHTPISPPSRARRRRFTPRAADTTWQHRPDPPAHWKTVPGRGSPAWDFFKVPLGSSKATAGVVLCHFCQEQVSRGQPCRVNQARGTTSMLRHLYIRHWDLMTPEFKRKYHDSRINACRRSAGIHLAHLAAAGQQSVLGPAPADSNHPAPPTSRPIV